MGQAELPSICPECGAPQYPDATCRLCFEGLLAFEAERPAAFGAVHHLTVTSWVLQHPAGYSREALLALREQLSLILTGEISISGLRRLNTQRFSGAAKVKATPGNAVARLADDWEMHVIDVFDPRGDLPATDAYVERARAWAMSIRDRLSRADRTGK